MDSHHVTAARAINALITSERRGRLIVCRWMRAEDGGICC